jgi:hypothetical protein
MTFDQIEDSASLTPNPKRIALALVLFLALLSSFLWIAIYRIPFFTSYRERKEHLSHDISPDLDHNDTFFYQSVGAAPFFDAPAEYHSRSLEDELNLLSTSSSLSHRETESHDAESARLPEAYTIEVAALTDKEATEKLVESLKLKGIQAFYTPLLSQNFVIYRVRIGVFQSHDSAIKTLASIKKHLKTKAVVSALR